VLEYLPGAHAEHVVAFSRSEKLPAEHEEQTLLLIKVPGKHFGSTTEMAVVVVGVWVVEEVVGTEVVEEVVGTEVVEDVVGLWVVVGTEVVEDVVGLWVVEDVVGALVVGIRAVVLDPTSRQPLTPSAMISLNFPEGQAAQMT
jgi:hypothetical protein